MHSPLLSLFAMAMVAASAVGQERDRTDTPVATATRATTPIRVDGRLDESDWHRAPPIGRLTQREPLQGQPPTEPTTIRILVDDDAPYFGIECVESHPGGLVSTQLLRDADLSVDDSVTIVLDPFFDHRNGFFFQANPAGALLTGRSRTTHKT